MTREDNGTARWESAKIRGTIDEERRGQHKTKQHNSSSVSNVRGSKDYIYRYGAAATADHAAVLSVEYAMLGCCSTAARLLLLY